MLIENRQVWKEKTIGVASPDEKPSNYSAAGHGNQTHNLLIWYFTVDSGRILVYHPRTLSHQISTTTFVPNGKHASQNLICTTCVLLLHRRQHGVTVMEWMFLKEHHTVHS